MNTQLPLLFAPGESRELAASIARAAGLELAPLEERDFDGGEFKLRPLVPVRQRTALVVQSLAGTPAAPVTHRLVRLLFLLMGLRDAGADRLVAVVPYLAFARKDRRTQPRDPVTARYVAELLEAAGTRSLLTLDVHNPAALDNAFRVPVDHLTAAPMFVDHFAALATGAALAVASPDVGGIKRAQLFRELLQRRVGRDVDLAFVEKRRSRGILTTGRVTGEVADREVIVLDDLCASGGTLIRAATALREAGARTVHVAFTHAPSPEGIAALTAEATISRIVTTDSTGCSLPDLGPEASRIARLPTGPLLGTAIARMLRGAPLAPLLDRWPLDPGD